MRLIGISGRAGAGKDTVAKMLQYLTLSDYSYTRTNQLSYNQWLQINEVTNSKTFQDYTIKDISDWQIIRFADKVKDIVCTLIDCTRGDLEKEEFKTKNVLCGYSPRQLLQLVGTDFGRNVIHKDIWVNLTFRNYDEYSKWLISDVRFKNELEIIQKNKGIVIRVIRPELESMDQHESEVNLKDNDDIYDYVIYNDGNINSLLEEVAKLYQTLETDLLGRLS